MDAVFLPYEIVEQRPGYLCLQLNAVQKWLNILLFRGLPLFLFFMVPLVTAMAWKNSPPFFLPGMALLLVLAGFLGSRDIITGLTFTASELEIRRSKYLWTQTDRRPWSEADHIRLTLEPSARGGRSFYSLVGKDGSATVFAVFPVVFQLNREKLRDLNLRFQELTGLTVQEKS